MSSVSSAKRTSLLTGVDSSCAACCSQDSSLSQAHKLTSLCESAQQRRADVYPTPRTSTRFLNLFDDLPSPFSIASHQSSQQAAARAWSFAFALAVSYSAQPLDVFCAFGDWSFRKLLVKGSRADPVGVSRASSLHLSECVAASDHGALDHISFFVGCLLNL